MEIHSSVNLGPRVQVAPRGRSRTKQSFREESEITNIMARYVKTGLIDHFSSYGPEYGFASSVTFHEAMNVVTKADQMFQALPAATRQRFAGDPALFLDFVQNPENQAEMVTLGLASAPEGQGTVVAEPLPSGVSAPIAPEVVADPPEGGSGS